MKTLYISLLLSANLFALTYEADEGETLYMEQNCQKCHYSGDDYDPKNYKVKELKDINRWVTGCAVHFKIAWFPEEEKAVSKYLNEVFYKLKE